MKGRTLESIATRAEAQGSACDWPGGNGVSGFTGTSWKQTSAVSHHSPSNMSVAPHQGRVLGLEAARTLQSRHPGL